MLRHQQSTIASILTLFVISALGFIMGVADGIRSNTKQLSPIQNPRNTEIRVELSNNEFRQGSAPEILVRLHCQHAIPRDIADFLRLQLAIPGGWDTGRSVKNSEKIVIAVSDDGCSMELLAPLSAFQKHNRDDQKIGLAFHLDSVGEHEIRICLDWTSHQSRSNPVSFTVISNALETVQRCAPHPRPRLRASQRLLAQSFLDQSKKHLTHR